MKFEAKYPSEFDFGIIIFLFSMFYGMATELKLSNYYYYFPILLIFPFTLCHDKNIFFLIKIVTV